MNVTNRTSAVGVFCDHTTAQRAVNDLKRAGFSDDQIGVVGRHDETGLIERRSGDSEEVTESFAGEGAATGLAAGAGIGALWGLGVLAGVIPAIGPAIAGGTLAALLSSAAAGAVAAGLAGSLIGMGIPKEDAEFYESEVHSGRVIVTVSAIGREVEARAILRSNSGYDAETRPTTAVPGATSEIGGTSNVQSAIAEENFVLPVNSANSKTLDIPVSRGSYSSDTQSNATAPTAQQVRIPVNEESVNLKETTLTPEAVGSNARLPKSL